MSIHQLKKLALAALFLYTGSICTLVFPSCIFGMSKTAPKIELHQKAIGVRTLQYEDKTRDRPITVELWYPTDDTTAPLDIPSDKIWIHPKELRDVEISSKQSLYPFILMSHGHKGDRRERSWLAELLVRRGFIVASVDHYGSAWNQYNPLAAIFFWDRAKDISFTLGQLLENSIFKNHLDSDRIGFVGYSLGGMTGLALAGAQAKNAQAIAQKYKQEISELPPEMLEKVDYSAAEKNYHDPRIKAFLLLCPATFAYPSETFRQIKVPIGLIASLDDEILPHKEHALRLLQNLTIHRLKLMKNKISHYAFLNCVTENGLKILQEMSKTCPKKWDWAPVHKEVGKFAINFFEETLGTGK